VEVTSITNGVDGATPILDSAVIEVGGTSEGGVSTVTSLDTTGDFDAAASQTGVVHASISNTDFTDDGTVTKALPVGESANISDGLVGWWPLHTTTGVAPDLSGNGNNGTVNGATRGVAGVGGLQAMGFGGGSHVDLSSIISQGSFSVSVRFRGDTLGSDDRIISLREDVRFILNVGRSGTDTLGIWWAGTDYGATTINPDQWYHAVARYDGGAGEVDLYLNASKVLTQSVSWDSDDGGSAIGAKFDGSSPWDGPISGVRIYDRVLTTAEIQTLYDQGSQTGLTDPRLHDGSDAGAVARYQLDGDATDAFGSNDGGINGVTFVDDAIRGRAASFDGNDDFIEVGGGPFELSTLTFSAWVY
jgi:hypothetical protein